MKSISLALLLVSASSFAAYYEFDLSYGAAFPGFSFNSAPVAFSVYPWEHFGFSAGIENSIRVKENKGGGSGFVEKIDRDGDLVVVSYKAAKHSEKLSAQLLQVPLMLKLRGDYFYAAVGARVGFPQKVNIKVSYSGLKTEACIPDWEVCVGGDKFSEWGIGEQRDSSFRASIKAKPLMMFALESGARFKIAGGLALVLCAFADYSINKGFRRNLPPALDWVEYEGGADVRISDSWKSWKPWSAGAAAKLSFGFGGGKAAAEEASNGN